MFMNMNGYASEFWKNSIMLFNIYLPSLNGLYTAARSFVYLTLLKLNVG